jgi:hypothetical protein
LLPGTAGSDLAAGMDVCLVNVAEVSATGRKLVQRFLLRVRNVSDKSCR